MLKEKLITEKSKQQQKTKQLLLGIILVSLAVATTAGALGIGFLIYSRFTANHEKIAEPLVTEKPTCNIPVGFVCLNRMCEEVQYSCDWDWNCDCFQYNGSQCESFDSCGEQSQSKSEATTGSNSIGLTTSFSTTVDSEDMNPFGIRNIMGFAKGKLPRHHCANFPQEAFDMEIKGTFERCCKLCYLHYNCTAFELRDGNYGIKTKCLLHDKEQSEELRGIMYYKAKKPYLDDQNFCHGSFQNYEGENEDNMWIQTMSMDPNFRKLNLAYNRQKLIGFGRPGGLFTIYWPKTCIFRAYLQNGGKNLEENLETGQFSLDEGNRNSLTQYFFAENVVDGGGQHYIRSLWQPDRYFQAVVDENCRIKTDEAPVFASLNLRCPRANQWIMGDGV